MKAAYVKTRNKVQIRDVEAPTPSTGEVVLQVEGCGICGSDFLEADSWAKKWKRFGHEIAGRIIAVGTDVEDFAQGDQVALGLSAPCGQCPHCLAGIPRHCTSLLIAEQGGFAEQLLVPDPRLLYKAPEPMDPSLLIFAEPLTVLLDAFHTVGLKKNDRLAVVGGGFIACLGILVAKSLGITSVLSLSRSSHPGLTACIDAAKGEDFQWNKVAGVTTSAPSEFMARLGQGPGRRVILHTAPARYILNYFDMLPFDTTVLNIGLSAKAKENILKIDASKLIFKRIQIMSGFPVPCLYLEEAIKLLCRNRKLFSLLSPEKVILKDLPAIISSRPKHKRKIMVVPGSSSRNRNRQQ